MKPGIVFAVTFILVIGCLSVGAQTTPVLTAPPIIPSTVVVNGAPLPPTAASDEVQIASMGNQLSSLRTQIANQAAQIAQLQSAVTLAQSKLPSVSITDTPWTPALGVQFNQPVNCGDLQIFTFNSGQVIAEPVGPAPNTTATAE